MSIATFRVHARRPTKLSDPYGDFAPATLAAILALPDDQFTYVDYECILGPILPAGTYKEILYFLPGAFRYLLGHEETDVLVPAVVGFVSKNAETLAQDSYLDESRACVRELLDHWTRAFDRRHLGHLIQTLEALVYWKTQVDIANDFVQSLADHGTDIVKAAWFLTYAADQLNTQHGYKPSEYSPIVTLLTDYDRLQHAVKIIAPIVGDMPDYWQIIFSNLGLDLI